MTFNIDCHGPHRMSPSVWMFPWFSLCTSMRLTCDFEWHIIMTQTYTFDKCLLRWFITSIISLEFSCNSPWSQNFIFSSGYFLSHCSCPVLMKECCHANSLINSFPAVWWDAELLQVRLKWPRKKKWSKTKLIVKVCGGKIHKQEFPHAFFFKFTLGLKNSAFFISSFPYNWL